MYTNYSFITLAYGANYLISGPVCQYYTIQLIDVHGLLYICISFTFLLLIYDAKLVKSANIWGPSRHRLLNLLSLFNMVNGFHVLDHLNQIHA